VVDRMKNVRKVICIGLDGATFDLIRPWLSKGKLPNIGRIIKDGVWGELESVIPPVSAPAWTSFMTGKNPGKHGIFGFKKEKQGTYEELFVNRKLIKSETLWKCLSDVGKKVIVINVPLTYPPEEINGYLMSGMDTPSIKSPFTYPPQLKEEINKITQGKYKIHQHFGGYLINDKRKKQALEEILSSIDIRTNVAEHLMQKYPWDFFMIKFDNPDQVQHYFWKDMNDEDNMFKDAILRVYQHLDNILGKFLNLLDKRTTLLVVSDHGAGPVNGKRIYINEWLRRKGMLVVKDFSDRKRKNLLNRFRKIGLKSLEKMYFLAGKIISYRVRDRFGISLPILKPKLRSFMSHLNINWTKTKAYFGGNLNAVYINLEGRRPDGIVKPGEEYEQVREEIINGLKSIADPDDGLPVFQHVYKKEEVYHGSLLEEAPDILVIPRNFSDYTMGKEILTNDKKPVIAYRPSPRGVTGNHRLNGIFLTLGENIRKGEQIKGARIIDLFPTIYHMFGLQIPADIDGKSLDTIFTPEWLAENPVRISDTGTGIKETKEDVYSKEDEAEIRKRLKGLGYI
jgi:predicted AlkP superfamily phosphohydrolase/phosphomutase